MSDEQMNNVDPSELDTTAPNPAPTRTGQTGEWRMPEPVFQQSSGYLPQGFEKRFAEVVPPTTKLDPDALPAELAAASSGTAETPAEVPFDANITMVGAPMPMDLPKKPAKPPSSVAPIEPPQPEFPDTLTDFSDATETPAQPTPPSTQPKKRSGWRTVMILLALGAAIGLLVVFLIAVYFLFLLPSPEASSF